MWIEIRQQLVCVCSRFVVTRLPLTTQVLVAPGVGDALEQEYSSTSTVRAESRTARTLRQVARDRER